MSKKHWQRMVALCLVLVGMIACAPLSGPDIPAPSGPTTPSPEKQPPPKDVASGVVVLPKPPQTSDTPAPTPGAITSSAAPLSQGQDRADRGCQVILRRFYRVMGTAGAPQTHCQDGLCWWVFKAEVDVADAALSSQWQPMLSFHSTTAPGTWHAVAGQPTAGAASGFQRYTFTLQTNTIRTGLSATALQRSEMGFIPFLQHYSQGRLFDHNRIEDDLAHYRTNQAGNWTIDDEAGVCGPRTHATLRFLAGWQQRQHGAIVAGGDLVVDYNLVRLPQCHGSSYMSRPDWNTIAYARFLPGGELQQAALLKGEGPNGTYLANEARFSVPQGATAVELWFMTSGRTCSPSWDSNFGKNYRFAVQQSAPAAVKWAGDWASGLARDCSHRPGLAEPVTIDSYVLTRGCHQIFADVYVPGLTDGDQQHPEHIQAQVQYRVDGGDLKTAWLTFVKRAGNNYRYVWTFPASEMIHSPNWQRYFFAFRFSTDGLNWHRIGQADGPQGGAFRTLLKQ